MDFIGKDILSLLDFSREDIEMVFNVADKLERVVEERTRIDILKDKVLGALFFQPSTRTRLSFESAMLRLGGGITGFADAKVTRAGDKYKETIADTARVIQNYVDVVAMRHFDDGAPAEFAKYADIPVINAGDGINEHPTQGLLDLYTVKKELGKIDGTQILIISDLKNERVTHSLLYGFSKFNDVQVYLMSPPNLRLPNTVVENLEKLKLKYRDVGDLSEVVDKVDVVYCNVIQEQRDAPATPDRYVVNAKKLKNAKEGMIVLHCLPRLDELTEDVDPLPHAKYFEQTKYGVITRMALLCMVFGRNP